MRKLIDDNLHLLGLLMAGLMALAVYAPVTAQRLSMDLSGHWKAQLQSDSSDWRGKSGCYSTEHFAMPGTTDTNGLGIVNNNKGETTHLSRIYRWFGKVEYSITVDVPESWRGKCVRLLLERTKPTLVYWDGRLVGQSDDISTRQEHWISKSVKSGLHKLVIIVDNGYRVPNQLMTSSHAYTADTQTNWNGILGDIRLEAMAQQHITNMTVVPDVAKKGIWVTFSTSRKMHRHDIFFVGVKPKNFKGKYSSKLYEADSCKLKGDSVYRAFFALGDDVKLWDEFSPNLYEARVTLSNMDRQTLGFGLRTFKTCGYHFYVNGKKTFLRGKHDACVFPLTAHVPMDRQSWVDYFTTLRQYGINHVRFHSWCPPEQCFKVADEMGFYLQPELPFWGDFKGDDKRLMDFLHKEGHNIIDTYGHHPSFVMFALGNELWGSVERMADFVADYRQQDSTKLYTFGSNFYLGYKGWLKGMDFMVTCRNGGEAWGTYDTHTRGSFSFADAYDGGLINHSYPNTTMTLDRGCASSPVPVVSHETGQFQVYPDYSEMADYTGVLRPYNMNVFKQRLQQAGMGDQATDFHRASGRWAVELYKADIELDMRTRTMAGYQLLDLQDYPGQGSAYVGILDAFMRSKGLVSPSQWRQWCSPIVPMLSAPKYCYKSGESLTAKVLVANYGGHSLAGKRLKWTLTNTNGRIQDQGEMYIAADSLGLLDLGTINVNTKLPSKINERLTFNMSIEGTKAANSYPIWIYSNIANVSKIPNEHPYIIICDTIEAKTLDTLARGAKVLLMPKSQRLTVGPLFQTDYWNYRMFNTICRNNKKPVSPGTLGLLCNPKAAALKLFPTDAHTSWQWFPIIKGSRPFILDNAPNGYKPLVQVIDNVERNHKLGLIFEFRVGNGRLLVCMSRLDKQGEYTESMALYRSLLNYMDSPDFTPSFTLSPKELTELLTKEVGETGVKELRNISFD